jgi:hypothetical protein
VVLIRLGICSEAVHYTLGRVAWVLAYGAGKDYFGVVLKASRCFIVRIVYDLMIKLNIMVQKYAIDFKACEDSTLSLRTHHARDEVPL